MNNLTNEERARIFAMYLGSQLNVPFKEKLEGIKKDYEVDNWYCQTIDCDFRVDVVKLILTPLSKITDEHAIEVAKIIHNGKWTISGRNDCFIALFCDELRLIIPFDLEVNSVHLFEVYNETEQEMYGRDSDTIIDYEIIDIIDRLRELGYALPYKGHSLFELGIAIEKTLV